MGLVCSLAILFAGYRQGEGWENVNGRCSCVNINFMLSV